MLSDGTSQTTIGGLRQDLVLIPTASFILAFVSGLMTSGRLAGRQFLAENAHRLPTTVGGWYFYQKTKNYRVLFGGLRGGLRTGLRLGAWTTAFVAVEEGAEMALQSPVGKQWVGEHRTRAVSGALAGVGLAAAAHAIYRLSRHGNVRRYGLAVVVGAMAGGVHDLRDILAERKAAEEAKVRP